MTLVLLLMLQERTTGGHGLIEAVPRIYQVTPDIPDRRRATQQTEVRPSPADTLKESQLAARSGPSPPRRTSPTTRIQTASLNAIARFRPGRRHAALPLLVRLSSERVRQAVPQDCSFAEKQASPPALLAVVRSESDTGDRAGWRSGRKSKRPVLLLARSGTLSRRMESYAFLASYV